MPLRHWTAGLALALGGSVLLAGTAGAAPSPYDDGLLGRQDPVARDSAVSYSVGAFPQALALLGVAAGGRGDAPQAAAAVQWLTRQQCPDGGWQYYRADPAAACTPPNPATYSGEDTNSTAVAVEALAAVHASPPADPLAFLRRGQNRDGGWGYVPGAASDPNSTALVIQAFLASGVDPATVTAGGGSPYDALVHFQLGCAAPPADRGGFYAFDPNSPDVLATAQALPAAAGKAFPLTAATLSDTAPAPTCPAAAKAPPASRRPGGAPAAPGRRATSGRTGAAKPHTSAKSRPDRPATAPATTPTGTTTATATATPSGTGTATPRASAGSPTGTPTPRTASEVHPVAYRVAATTGTDPSTAAGYGATWLAGQVTAGGYVAGPGGPAYGNTAYAALGLAASGTNAAAARRAAGYLAGHVDAVARDAQGLDKVGSLGLLAMVAAAVPGSGSDAGALADRILGNCTGTCTATSASPTPTTAGGAASPSSSAAAPSTPAGTAPNAGPDSGASPAGGTGTTAPVAAQGGGGGLPFTGAAVGLVLLLAGTCGAAGVGIRYLGRRRPANARGGMQR